MIIEQNRHTAKLLVVPFGFLSNPSGKDILKE